MQKRATWKSRKFRKANTASPAVPGFSIEGITIYFATNSKNLERLILIKANTGSEPTHQNQHKGIKGSSALAVEVERGPCFDRVLFFDELWHAL